MARRRTEPGFGDRIAAYRAHRRAAAPAIVYWPDPAPGGSPARGAALLDGRFWTRPPGFDTAPEARAIPGGDLWALDRHDGDASGALHAHLWLDDLAAIGSRAAARTALDWLTGWQGRYGAGRGPGWTPGRTARRALAWAGHLDFLAGGAGGDLPAPLRRGLDQHLMLLSRGQAGGAGTGFERVEAGAAAVLLGLVLADRAVPGLAAMPHFLAALGQAVEAPGAATGRSPARLLRIALLALRVRTALVETGHTPSPGLAEALARLAPRLRALCHADGGLSRFRGGGAGVPGALDRVLAEAPAAAQPAPFAAMGYGRLAAGGTSVILDAGRPGTSDSRLALELTAGRAPLVVAAGMAVAIPPGTGRMQPAKPSLNRGARDMIARLDLPGGFTAERRLWLDPGGAVLAGRDRLRHGGPPGAPVPGLWLRFPLHPAIGVETIDDGSLYLIPAAGPHWLFAHDGPVARNLETWEWFDQTDPVEAGPREALAIVLRAPAGTRSLELDWMFERGGAPGASGRGARQAGGAD
jgi:uncharacterized heparinase superfamily protein